MDGARLCHIVGRQTGWWFWAYANYTHKRAGHPRGGEHLKNVVNNHGKEILRVLKRGDRLKKISENPTTGSPELLLAACLLFSDGSGDFFRGGVQMLDKTPAPFVLPTLEMFPLSLHQMVGFELRVRFNDMNSVLDENSGNGIDQHGVDPFALILRFYGNQVKVSAIIHLVCSQKMKKPKRKKFPTRSL
jgi:hypothetical protein